MKFAALLLVGAATVATAAAQNSSSYAQFLPMPNRMPAMLFAPDPLAGTLLGPLTVPAAGEAADVAIVPIAAAPSQTMAQAAPEEPLPADELEPVAPTAVIVPPESEPDPQPAVIEPEPTTETATAPAIVEEPAPPPVVATPLNGKVTVIVENVETDTGSVNVAVCDKGLSREGCPYVQEVKAQLGFVETEFDDIPPGTYAVVGYHDVNGNNEFDKLLGMPREPYALSNNAGEKLIPTFGDASLTINAGDNAVIIRLRRLGG